MTKLTKVGSAGYQSRPSQEPEVIQVFGLKLY